MKFSRTLDISWPVAGLISAVAGGLSSLIYLLPPTQRLGVSNAAHGLTLAIVVVLMVRAARLSGVRRRRERTLGRIARRP